METKEFTLRPVKEKDALEKSLAKDEFENVTWYTHMIYLEIYVVLSKEKKVNLTISSHSDDKAMEVAEQVAELYGETKYSISFFKGGSKINLNDKLADLGLGYYKVKKRSIVLVSLLKRRSRRTKDIQQILACRCAL